MPAGTRPTGSKQTSFARMMAPLRERYLKNLSVSCEEMKGIRHDLHGAAITPALIGKLSLMAHSMAGSGATYGFPDISRKAAALDDCLQAETARTAMIDRLGELIAACEALQDRPIKIAVQDLAMTGTAPEQLPTVLVVDDNPDIRSLFASLLAGSADVVSARSAADAFCAMDRSLPDLILLDDSMPGGMSGTAMLEELRLHADYSSVPVIMVTGNKDAAKIHRALQAHVLDYITKPFQPQQVAERIKAHLIRLRTAILIVDDDTGMRALLFNVFTAAGFHARLAWDGSEALALMEKEKPDIVLLDFMMPAMNGDAVLRAMKDNPSLADIPVIFLTAKKDLGDVDCALKLGAVDYIVKPIAPAKVLKRCLQLMEARPRRR